MDKVTSKQGWDLVFKLYRGGMSLVIDKIFNYLEVDCLDAEFVLSDKLKPIFASCNFWKKQLMKKVHLSKDWKDMYDIVEATKPDLIHEEDGYQTAYYLISGKLMNLESYWNLGMAIPKKISFFSPIHHADLTPNLPQPPYDFYPTPSRSFGFNKTLVVIAEELEGSKLIIRNRYNLKLVKVLDLPALRPSPRPIDRFPVTAVLSFTVLYPLSLFKY